MASKNLFISWSGDLSKKVAQEFNDWIPSVIQAIKPYFSPDMKKGIFWGPEINKQLSELKLGILIITPDNKDSTWIHYEAGGLISKLEDKDIVCPICFNLKPTDLAQPLGGLNATVFDKEEIYKLLDSLNNSLEELKLDSKILNDEFELKWPKLEDSINKILSKWKPSESTPEPRSHEEKIDEILSLTRDLSQYQLIKDQANKIGFGKGYTLIDDNYNYTVNILKDSESEINEFIKEIGRNKLIKEFKVIKYPVGGYFKLRIKSRSPFIYDYLEDLASEFDIEIKNDDD